MASSNQTDLEGWALRSIQNSIGREMPRIQGRLNTARFSELRQGYFRHFRIIQCAIADEPIVYAAYRADNSSVFLLTGRQQSLRLIAAIDPVMFRKADDVLEFAAFADKVTSEDVTPVTTISSVEEIAGKGLSTDEKTVLADIQDRFRDRIQPVERQFLAFGLQERFHVVSMQCLIERTRMIASGGLFFREDEVLADNLPLALK